MKSFLKLVLAAALGGSLAFAAFKWFDKDTIIYEPIPFEKKVSETSVKPSGSIDLSTDFVVAAEKANPAVVHISAQNKAYVNYNRNRQDRYDPFEDFFFFRRNNDRPQAGTGSGVIISDDGYIVTNNHVVGFADYVEVTLEDGKTFSAEKIGTDPSTDLAVLRIEGEQLPYLQFDDSENVKVGQWVVAVGNPFNLTSTVTAGIVSAKGRDLDIIQNQKSIEEFIQTDAVVNPGNSGGALVNLEGKLIGINTAISSPTGVYAGYSFAIPSNLVKRVIDEIIEEGGDIHRAFLGIVTYDAADVKEQGISVPVDYGVYVGDFIQDRYGRKIYRSAEFAGVEIGDVITDVGNQKVNDGAELREALKFVKIGDTVTLTVNRNGKKKVIPVKIRQGL